MGFSKSRASARDGGIHEANAKESAQRSILQFLSTSVDWCEVFASDRRLVILVALGLRLTARYSRPTQ